jgi:hypothetical protein
MTYLSFKCFLQLYKFIPYSTGTNNYLSCALCVFILFALLIVIPALGFAPWMLTKGIFEIENFTLNRWKSHLLYTSLLLLGKCGAGFFHAHVDEAFDRAFGLLFVNCFALAAMIACIKGTELKIYGIFFVSTSICKVLLHLQLAV